METQILIFVRDVPSLVFNVKMIYSVLNVEKTTICRLRVVCQHVTVELMLILKTIYVKFVILLVKIVLEADPKNVELVFQGTLKKMAFAN